MDEFEVHLSKTSMNIFADKRLASFKNQLPQDIFFEGDWRVALSEIIFLSEINNLYTDFFYHVYKNKGKNYKDDDYDEKNNEEEDVDKSRAEQEAKWITVLSENRSRLNRFCCIMEN